MVYLKSLGKPQGLCRFKRDIMSVQIITYQNDRFGVRIPLVKQPLALSSKGVSLARSNNSRSSCPLGTIDEELYRFLLRYRQHG